MCICIHIYIYIYICIYIYISAALQEQTFEERHSELCLVLILRCPGRAKTCGETICQGHYCVLLEIRPKIHDYFISCRNTWLLHCTGTHAHITCVYRNIYIYMYIFIYVHQQCVCSVHISEGACRMRYTPRLTFVCRQLGLSLAWMALPSWPWRSKNQQTKPNP